MNVGQGLLACIARCRAGAATAGPADYNHEAWFFGRGDLPRWLGYSLGFRLVERFLSEHPGSQASKLAVVQAQELRPTLNLV